MKKFDNFAAVNQLLMNHNFPSGVLTGSVVQDLFQFAKRKAFALLR